MEQGKRHPIAAGVTALVAVAVGVGLIVGIGMFVGANILGLGGDGAASDQATDPDAGASLYAPSPKPTKTATGPAITLDASPTSAPEKKAGSVSASTSSSSAAADEKPAKKITLQTGVVVAKPMERIDITGIYPGGEGAILRLERDEGEGWEEFGIPDVSVTGEQFSTAIQTGRIGKHMFRMKDIDTGAYSNVVTVTIG
ncbi:hypothetical protein [Nocardioides panzhihuensis]|uniref:Uncharacterized protein n=1 Tax=Nocardioides panzhihuensis TaxID=860243 RepID=A0A7Z0DQW2_9ACTN|nr:hypothetical protein [Nocardioides panzhihuensis]NYI79722.1 hypothetical protein [Nocardioides panzhihuensis]